MEKSTKIMASVFIPFIAFSFVIMYYGAKIVTEDFNTERESMHDSLNCIEIESTINTPEKIEHRDYLNSLWIIKKCHTELEVTSIEELLGVNKTE